MATLNQQPDGKQMIFIKGAPERIIEICPLQREIAGDEIIDKDTWRAGIQAVAGSGQRPYL